MDTLLKGHIDFEGAFRDLSNSLSDNIVKDVDRVKRALREGLLGGKKWDNPSEIE